MKTKRSAGILLYRKQGESIEVLLVHPGGPFWIKKDEGAWSIPKGEFADGEEPLAAARREFEEETGFAAPTGDTIELQPQRQAGGKIVYAWAARGNLDPRDFKSDTFSLEWPVKSGKYREFPEVDRVEWFTIEVASVKILKGQAEFLAQLRGILK